MTAFGKILEKTAALLEIQAEQFDRDANQKTAAAKAELEERLGPALSKYEEMTGEKLAEEAKEKVFSDPNSPLVPILEKLAASSDEEHTGLGGPETRRKRDENSEKSAAPKPIGAYPHERPPVHRRGRRRSAAEIRQQSLRQESERRARYS